MPGTFSQIYIQIVFAVKNRDTLIDHRWEEHLFKYITGIVKKKGQLLIAINGVPDHIHFLLRIRPSCCLSGLIREIKKSTTSFIHDQNFSKYKFQWQEGYGSFSYSQSQVKEVVRYIQNQKQHHNSTSFKDEYKEFLKKFNIEFEEKYLFDWLE
jgi:REP element-mobilizing transposase RayT